ncbi:ricin-type beta-trefoil lectin domain protein [Streptomyces sp. bgisy022]|uniref:ricin-type beta-trefoil lectin domain protein n=1 Tax=Streptomyces sp. bgisy022 TaxID=3413769 RepID=UPI003D75A345
MAAGDDETVHGDGATPPGPHTGASDTRLTDLLRGDTAAAYAALRELRARHGPAVHAYARQCATGESTARQLAAQAFTLAARQSAHGSDPGGPLRHHLLLLTARVAASWAADGRAGGLDPGLHLLLTSAGPGGPVPPMLAAFRTLPYRTQGLLWYGVVERESADRTAALLGVAPRDVAQGTDSALRSLGQACLRGRLAASDDPRCADFRRLITEAVRPDAPRDSADLHTHRARCSVCTAAYEELCALRDAPAPTLAEGLLPWAGTAYAARAGRAPAPSGPDSAAAGAGAAAPAGAGFAALRSLPRSRRLVLASAVLGVGVLPLLLFLRPPAEPAAEDTAGSSVPLPVPPPVTVTATPSSSAPPSPPTGTPSPSRTRPPGPSQPPRATPSPTREAPAYPPPGAAYAPVVNVARGLCLDIRGGVLEKRTDVVTAPCDSSPTQRWRFDRGRGVLQSAADPDYCLDSRGAVDRGVGIWECDSVDGRNGQNLRFAVDARGVIRPAIAPGHALTPSGGDAVSLVAETGRADQRWRAGS